MIISGWMCVWAIRRAQGVESETIRRLNPPLSVLNLNCEFYFFWVLKKTTNAKRERERFKKTSASFASFQRSDIQTRARRASKGKEKGKESDDQEDDALMKLMRHPFLSEANHCVCVCVCVCARVCVDEARIWARRAETSDKQMCPDNERTAIKNEKRRRRKERHDTERKRRAIGDWTQHPEYS